MAFVGGGGQAGVCLFIVVLLFVHCLFMSRNGSRAGAAQVMRCVCRLGWRSARQAVVAPHERHCLAEQSSVMAFLRGSLGHAIGRSSVAPRHCANRVDATSVPNNAECVHSPPHLRSTPSQLVFVCWSFQPRARAAPRQDSESILGTLRLPGRIARHANRATPRTKSQAHISIHTYICMLIAYSAVLRHKHHVECRREL